MGLSTTRMAVITGSMALGLALVGCGSDSGSTATQTSETSPTSEASTSTTPAAAGTTTAAASTQTVADYLDEVGVTMTPVKRGDPGSPTLDLPIPQGWSDIGPDTPQDAWGAIAMTDPPSDNPPAIVARMAKLSGEADHAKILELAPNAVKNQPGYDGPETGRPSTLGGFDAVEIAGTVTVDGAPTFVARKTVVIPGQDALYLLALDAQGTPDQEEALILAMAAIDEGTTITP